MVMLFGRDLFICASHPGVRAESVVRIRVVKIKISGEPITHTLRAVRAHTSARCWLPPRDDDDMLTLLRIEGRLVKPSIQLLYRKPAAVERLHELLGQ